MLTWLLVLGCKPTPPVEPRGTTPEPVPSTPVPVPQPAPVTTSDTAGATGDTAAIAPCTGIEAIFFDLGETLVTDIGQQFAPIPGTAETIAALPAAGIRIGIITNTEPGWNIQDLRDLLTTPDLLDAFEVVLMSSQASSPPKPSRAIFLEAHSMMIGGPPIERTAFVTEETEDLADSVQSPTEGARSAGMFGVLIADEKDALADETIPDLPSILTADWLGCP